MYSQQKQFKKPPPPNLIFHFNQLPPAPDSKSEICFQIKNRDKIVSAEVEPGANVTIKLKATENSSTIITLF